MEKLKELKPKHKHLFTDILKIAIFSLIMLAPFLAVGAKCAYVALNKNAKDSYSNSESFTYYEKVEYHTNEVNSIDDLVIGNVYSFNAYTHTNTLLWEDFGNFYLEIYNVLSAFVPDYFSIDEVYPPFEFNKDNFNYIASDFTNELVFSIFGWQNSMDEYSFNLYFDLNGESFSTISQFHINFLLDEDTFTNINLTLEDVVNEEFIEFFNIADLSECVPTYIEKTTEVSTLDNVFYDSVEELGEKPLFAWTKDTALYESIKLMTDGLDFGQESNILALLLTYWSLNTLIYIVFDIIITIFTKITHFIAS